MLYRIHLSSIHPAMFLFALEKTIMVVIARIVEDKLI